MSHLTTVCRIKRQICCFLALGVCIHAAGAMTNPVSSHPQTTTLDGDVIARSATGRQLTLSRNRDPPTVGRNGLFKEQTWVGKKRKFDYGAHTSCIIAHTYTSLNLPTAKSAWTGGISPNCSFHLPRLRIWWEGNHTALRTVNNVISRVNGSRISF